MMRKVVSMVGCVVLCGLWGCAASEAEDSDESTGAIEKERTAGQRNAEQEAHNKELLSKYELRFRQDFVLRPTQTAVASTVVHTSSKYSCSLERPVGKAGSDVTVVANSVYTFRPDYFLMRNELQLPLVDQTDKAHPVPTSMMVRCKAVNERAETDMNVTALFPVWHDAIGNSVTPYRVKL